MAAQETPDHLSAPGPSVQVSPVTRFQPAAGEDEDVGQTFHLLPQ